MIESEPAPPCHDSFGPPGEVARAGTARTACGLDPCPSEVPGPDPPGPGPRARPARGRRPAEHTPAPIIPASKPPASPALRSRMGTGSARKSSETVTCGIYTKWGRFPLTLRRPPSILAYSQFTWSLEDKPADLRTGSRTAQGAPILPACPPSTTRFASPPSPGPWRHHRREAGKSRMLPPPY